MAEKKTILEEALLDIKNIQNALNANTKEILRSVAKEEIDSVVKESLTKEVYEEEDVDGVEEVPAAGAEEKTSDMPTDLAGTGAPELGAEPEMGAEPELGTDPAGEEGMDGIASVGAGPEELDMTQSSDDDVIEIYKKLSGDDEIEIVGDEVHLNISEPGEYIVKAADGKAPGMDAEPEMGDDDVDYEIEMGDDEGGSEGPADLAPVDDEGGEEGSEVEKSGEEEKPEEEPIEEKISVGTGMSVGTHRNKTAAGSIGTAENPKSKLDEATAAKKLVSETNKKYNTLLTETKKLKNENEEFRKALHSFRSKLVETVVFNSNLTYVTRLFMEHSTTKAEKQNIIKRFDEEVTNLKESKKLYKTIANDLENRKPINEAVENKIIKEVSTSSSKQLNESTAYVDPSTKRILDLIKRVEAK